MILCVYLCPYGVPLKKIKKKFSDTCFRLILINSCLFMIGLDPCLNLRLHIEFVFCFF